MSRLGALSFLRFVCLVVFSGRDVADIITLYIAHDGGMNLKKLWGGCFRVVRVAG